LIVDCAVYVGGTRDPEHLPLPEAYERARSAADGFVWIGLLEPTFEEFDAVTEVLHLPALAVEDAVHAHQRPKLERYLDDDLLFAVLISARYVDPGAMVGEPRGAERTDCGHGYDTQLATKDGQPRCPHCRGITRQQRNRDTYRRWRDPNQTAITKPDTPE